MATVSSKIIRVNFGNSILDNPNWDKINQRIAKKSISGKE